MTRPRTEWDGRMIVPGPSRCGPYDCTVSMTFPGAKQAGPLRPECRNERPFTMRGDRSEATVSARKSFVSPLLRRPGGGWALQNERTGTIVASRIETAFDSASRRRGLLGRDGLEQGSALIIAPCNSVHMFFMRFAIDVAFVDREGVVRKTYHSLRPWRIGGALRGWAAVELPSGTLARTNTCAGDRLGVSDPTV